MLRTAENCYRLRASLNRFKSRRARAAAHDVTREIVVGLTFLAAGDVGKRLRSLAEHLACSVFEGVTYSAHRPPWRHRSIQFARLCT